VWKFSSCDGCQLTLLDCEDELLALAGRVRIAHFLEASSATVAGPYDVSLVEGSVTSASDVDRIRRVREQSRLLVTIGACASAGGIQALSHLANSTPISAHVPVDHELRGCPIDRGQLLDLLTALLTGRRPNLPVHSVCVQCKLRGTTCVLVADGTPCLGPVTQAGCGAICPAHRRGCYGCFGPMPQANPAALRPALVATGMSATGIARLYRTFNNSAPAFAQAAGDTDDTPH
jgi:coenzyme F420-reducing hydrogenase gamma subunit